MSFMEKMTGLMARPNQDAIPKDDIPWYLKIAARVLGILAGFFGILFGVWNCLGIITIDFGCVVSGMLQILAGFLVMAIEAPFCCMFIDFVQQLATKADSRPYWNRAAVYCGIAIPPILFCPGLGSLFGCGLIFGTGVLYGMMSLGKKATAEEMRSAATAAESNSNAQLPTKIRSGLVANEQPMAISGIPSFDSNV